ncbi:MAG: ATP-binding cassette domain-containing protein [Rhodanobacteraceae bacterium]|nr:MAG: ATP-binding cassette domain-containing protein [Rhodanobacteraceae bacterium]
MIELDIALDRGEFALELALASPARALALFGHSGCGKTSTLLAIAGLLHPRKGRIAIGEHVLFDGDARIDLPPARRELGVVFQDARLFPHFTARENLRYGMPRGATATAFDDVVQLLGLSALLKRRPGQLSGGQIRRVAIGRALLRQPHALLLDEPLANLHREARMEVLEHLRGLKRGFALTTILVSHQPDEVIALADSVARIEDGRLAALDDIETFRASVKSLDAPHLLAAG